MMATKKKTVKKCIHTSDDGRACKARAQKGEDYCWVHHPDGRARRVKEPDAPSCARVSPTGHQCRRSPLEGEKWCPSHHPDLPVRTAKTAKVELVGPRRCSKCFDLYRRGPSHLASMLKPEATLAYKTIALDQAPHYCDRCCVKLFPMVFTWPSLSATG